MNAYVTKEMVQSNALPTLSNIRHAMARYGPSANTLLIDVDTPEARRVAKALGLRVVRWFVGVRTWAVTYTTEST